MHEAPFMFTTNAYGKLREIHFGHFTFYAKASQNVGECPARVWIGIRDSDDDDPLFLIVNI